MKKISILLLIIHISKVYSQSNSLFHFNSSDKDLVLTVDWAINKALSFSHDNTDPVGYWYEAALPNREAFFIFYGGATFLKNTLVFNPYS
jgi:hypothetical protein